MKSFADLQSGLLKMATELCGGTVVIQKLLDGQPAPGWAFSAPGGTPSAAATNAEGKLIFDWNSAQPQATDLTETQQPGYRLVSSSLPPQRQPVRHGDHQRQDDSTSGRSTRSTARSTTTS